MSSSFIGYGNSHRLNLTRNPFGSLEHEDWLAIAIPLPAVVEAWESGSHIQIIGEKGCGKTTSLIWLTGQARSTEARYVYERIPEDSRRFDTPLTGLDCFLLDEAQRLSWWRWRGLLRAADDGMRLVIGSHTDHSARFRRRGLTLTTIHLTESVTRDHLAAIITNRITYFTIADDQETPSMAADGVDYLWQRFGGDLRATEFFLYEVFQSLDRPEPITRQTLHQMSHREA